MTNIRKEEMNKLTELAELIKGNQSLIEELIKLAKEEKQPLYMMAIVENGVQEPAVGMDGNIVAGTMEEVQEKANCLLSMLPDYYREALDVQFVEINPELLKQLESELSDFYKDIEDAAENAAYEISDFVADPCAAKAKIENSIRADLRTAGVGLKNGKIERVNSSYWSEQEVPEDYDDEWDDEWNEYDDDYEDEDDECCDCGCCTCNHQEENDEGDILEEILNIIKKF